MLASNAFAAGEHEHDDNSASHGHVHNPNVAEYEAAHRINELDECDERDGDHQLQGDNRVDLLDERVANARLGEAAQATGAQERVVNLY